MRQYEGGAAERASARVGRLPEVQAAGQDHKVVRGDGRHPTGIPVATRTSEDIAPLGPIELNLSTTLTFGLIGAWGGWGVGRTLRAQFSLEHKVLRIFLLSYLLSGVPDTIKIIVEYGPNKYVHAISLIGIFLHQHPLEVGPYS